MIRVHTAVMTTRFGSDFGILLDDPAKPKYTAKKAEAVLKKQFGLKRRKNGELYWEDDPHNEAYFDYDGYRDMVLPDSMRVSQGEE